MEQSALRSGHQEKKESRAQKEDASGWRTICVTAGWDAARCEFSTHLSGDRRRPNAGKGATKTCFGRTER
jgi:hypothetical protein